MTAASSDYEFISQDRRVGCTIDLTAGRIILTDGSVYGDLHFDKREIMRLWPRDRSMPGALGGITKVWGRRILS